MSEPELSLNGLPLLYDHQQQAASFLNQFQPIYDLVLASQSIQRITSKYATVGPALIGLPKPNYPDPPPPRINHLYWPTGAARWSRGYFLASKTTADYLAAAAGTAVWFKASYDDVTLETDLYVLPPHPISCVENAETLYLIPVVDERYYWQFRNFGSFGKPSAMQWDVLYSYLASQLGITLETDTVEAAYLTPDPDEITRRYDNAATMLDAVAHSVGHRIVRQWDGTYRAINWTNSASTYQDNLTVRVPWYQIAGDAYTHQPLPDSVTVAFPRLACNTPDCLRRFHPVSVSYAGSLPVVSGTTKTIHSTAWAAINSQGAVTNSAELSTLANRIAADYYAGLEQAYDYTYAGIKEWVFTGYDDHALYVFGAEHDNPCLIAKTSVYEHSEGQWDADTEIKPRHVRLCTTRIQSMPLNFGVDQMLHQGQTYTEPQGLLPYQLGSTLMPGGTATGYPLVWNGLDWEVDTGCTVTLADPFYRNFLVAGERCWARKNCDSGYADVIGENGLRRTGLALTEITGGSTGNVLIYSGSLDDFGSSSCVTSTTGVTVNACHLPRAGAVNVQDVVFLQYHPDCFKWFVYANKGSSSVDPPRIAFGRLTEPIGPLIHDVLYSEVSDMVLIDGTRLDPDVVTARFRFGSAGETGDLAILLKVIDPPDESSSTASSLSENSECDMYIVVYWLWEFTTGDDVTVDGVNGRYLLTRTGSTYAADLTTIKGDTAHITVSFDSENRANLNASITGATLIGNTEPQATLSDDWRAEVTLILFPSDIATVVGDAEFTTEIIYSCQSDTWDVITIEHKPISPYVRIYYDTQTKKLKGVKRDSWVMYADKEYEEDILQGTDQCPE